MQQQLSENEGLHQESVTLQIWWCTIAEQQWRATGRTHCNLVHCCLHCSAHRYLHFGAIPPVQLSAGLVQLPIEQPAKLRHQDPNVKDQSSLNRLTCLMRCNGSWRTLLLLLTISEHAGTYCYSEDCTHLQFILDISFIYLRTSEPLWPVAIFWQRVSLTFSFGGGSRTLETSAPAALARYSITGVLNAQP